MFENSSNASLNDLSNLNAVNTSNAYMRELDTQLPGVNARSRSSMSQTQIAFFQGGNDVIELGNKNNIVYAGEGINLVSTGSGNDLIYSGSGRDFINAGDGRNVIFAGEGNNRILSGKGRDFIFSGAGDDTIYSGAGDDTIYAGNGNNLINAGTGNDTVYIGSGKDRIILEAGQGSVTIFGFDGSSDKLRLGESLLGKSLKFVTKGSDTLVMQGKDLLATLKDVAKGSQGFVDNGPLYRYTATDLGNPATTAQTVTVSAINDFGQVSGRYTRDGLFSFTNPTTGQPATRTVVQPFIWENGSIADLTRTGTKIGSSNFGAGDGATVTMFGGGGFINAMNSKGAIVGAADEVPGRGTDRATYWQRNSNGYDLSLYDFGGIESYFFDINNQNQAAGRHIYGPGSTSTASNRSRAVSFENGNFAYLPDLGGDTGTAFGINRFGSIVGTIDGDGALNDSTSNTAVVWKKNAAGAYELTNLGTFGAEAATLRDINDAGDIIGTSSSGSGSTATSTPFLLRDGEFTALGSLGGRTGSANGINEFGQVVGASQIASGANRAYSWNGGVMSDLNNLINKPLTINGSTVTLNNAVGVNNFGDIVATGTYTYTNAAGQQQTGTRSYVLQAVL
jgi:probable HAF family extracellular repeat protein